MFSTISLPPPTRSFYALSEFNRFHPDDNASGQSDFTLIAFNIIVFSYYDPMCELNKALICIDVMSL